MPAIEFEAPDANHAELINSELEKGHPDSQVFMKLMEADFPARKRFIKTTTGVERIAAVLDRYPLLKEKDYVS